MLNKRGNIVVSLLLVFLFIVVFNLINRAIWIATDGMDLDEITKVTMSAIICTVLAIVFVLAFGGKSDRRFLKERIAGTLK